jgi:hypothetical protein
MKEWLQVIALGLAVVACCAGYVIMVSDADGTAGILSTSAYYAIPTSASVFTIHNVSAITPAESTAYKLQFMTMGAGATH